MRALSWHRRKLAVLAAMVAVAALVQVLAPTPPPTVSVVAAAADLPGGRTLTAEDLTVVRLPPDVVPALAVRDATHLTGRVLAGSVTTRQVMTEQSVVSPRLTTASPDAVVMPVRLADADVIALLAVGDRVDIMAADPQQGRAEVVAAAARVVAVPAPAESGGPLGSSPVSGGRLVLIEVTRASAARVAAAATTASLTVIWRPG